MRILFLLFIVFASCTNGNNDVQQTITKDTVKALPPSQKPVDTIETKVYANDRFKDVTVQKTGDHLFLISGKARVFEATFSWVAEDGHNELKKGFEMTDAGAPEWGNFSFTADVKKERENSTVMLILFEASAKDGSRQSELPLVLY